MKILQKKGVSLIELLVASLILAISIVAILTSFTQGRKNTIENGKRAQAKKILTKYFEQISLSPSRAYVRQNGDWEGIKSYIGSTNAKTIKDTLDGRITEFKLSFDTTYVEVKENNQAGMGKAPSVLLIKGEIKWNNGANALTMYTGCQ